MFSYLNKASTNTLPSTTTVPFLQIGEFVPTNLKKPVTSNFDLNLKLHLCHAYGEKVNQNMSTGEVWWRAKKGVDFSTV